ncbi:cytochrome c [Bacterioplanes sanyensis]|nr:cytochrome c [Bacterioplanes sanyensis]
MAAIEQDASARQQALKDGEERAQLCFRCHGQDGNSKRDYIPNLASQNAAYLFTQFEKFANGERQDYVMSTLAKHLSADDRIDIALYFSEREVEPREPQVEASAAGERIYNSVCFACHGKEGHGSASYPRIAGQPYEFLETTLLKFLHNDPSRANSPMIAVMKNLDEQQVKDVAAYVAHMP